jgi:hypothetical protein
MPSKPRVFDLVVMRFVMITLAIAATATTMSTFSANSESPGEVAGVAKWATTDKVAFLAWEF